MPSAPALRATLLVAALALAGCGTGSSSTPSTPSGPSSAARSALTLSDPVTAFSGKADLAHPAIVADPTSDRVYVAWTTYPTFKEKNPPDDYATSFLAISQDGGRTFGAPVQLGGPDAIGEDHPVLRVAADGTLVVVWTHWDLTRVIDPKDPYSNPAWQIVQRSTDGGRTFGPPVEVPSTRPMRQGFFMNAALDPNGKDLAVSWFDYTSNVENSDTSQDMTTMLVASSHDGGATFGPSRVISTSTCVCCMPTGYSLGGRPGFVYRSAVDLREGRATRDIVAAQSSDSGDTWPDRHTVHADGFRLNECPHVGPGAVVDGSGTLHAAWWTGAAGRAGYWYATSTNGAEFTEPVRVTARDGVPHGDDVSLAVDPSGTVWIPTMDSTVEVGEYDSIGRILVWAIPPGGRPTQVSADSVPGALPQVTSTRTGAVLAWVDGGRLLVQRLGGEG